VHAAVRLRQRRGVVATVSAGPGCDDRRLVAHNVAVVCMRRAAHAISVFAGQFVRGHGHVVVGDARRPCPAREARLEGRRSQGGGKIGS
jgi:hypothetical protein